MSSTHLISPERAADYSPLSFLREHRTALAEHEVARLAEDLAGGRLHVAGDEARWYWRQLQWDSEHFRTPIIRLDGGTWEPGTEDPERTMADAFAASSKSRRRSALRCWASGPWH